MLLYSPQISDRLRFVCQFIEEHFLSDVVVLTDNVAEFANEKGFKINYSNQNIPDCEQIMPEGLLSEENIRSLDEDPYSCSSEEFLEKDIFACTFHSLSRYEEHQIKKRDEHGRFHFDFLSEPKQKMISRPFIDQLIISELRKFEKKNSQPLLSKRTPLATCTFDIDVAYAYKGRKAIRTIGSVVKNIVQQRADKNVERKKVMRGEIIDPFDTYELQKILLKKHNVDSRYFFLIGQGSKYDLGIDASSEVFSQLVKSVAENSTIGIHPSYHSFYRPEEIQREKQRLESILGEKVTCSRQHYLKFDLPVTYRNLIEAGIRNDFSMGYSNGAFFRAGTSFPFFFFDLESNKASKLRIFPLQWMDSIFIYNSALNWNDAENRLFEMIDQVIGVGGHFICNWHNNHLQNNEEFRPWRDLFQKMIEKLGKAF